MLDTMRAPRGKLALPGPRGAARMVLAGICVVLGACSPTDSESVCRAGDGVIAAGRLPDTAAPVAFRELWRVGTDAGQHLSVPLPLAVSRDGRAAIADFELGELFVIEPDGAWSGSIARSGMGPGELRSPVAAVWDDDGALHVYDLVKPAILHFDQQLSYTGEERAQSDAAAAIFASGELAWAGVQPSGATILIPGLRHSTDDLSTELVLRVAPPGADADTLGIVQIPTITAGDFDRRPVPGHARLSASVGAGGRLAVAGAAPQWRVDVHDNAGSRVFSICADAPASPLTPAEKGHGVDSTYATLAAAYRDAVPVQDPARHGRVVVGADGGIWVERERPEPYPSYLQHYGRAGSTFDVFDAEGRYTRTLRLPERARLQGALGDTIWAYEIGALDELSLVAYEVSAR